MTCETVRAALLEWPVEEFGELAPHLERCAGCRDLAAAIREGHAELDRGLDDFGAAVPFGEALVRARAAQTAPITTTGGPMWTKGMTGLVAAAAVTTLALGLRAVGPRTTPPEVEVADEVGASHGPCEDLKALESSAMMGRLDATTVACLEDRAHTDAPIASLRLLSVDAWVREDLEAWEGYAEQLADASPGDPDLHYKLALHYSKQGPERAEDVLLYAERAHEHREVWSGETRVRRVDRLWKLRASAALALWMAAPDDPAARQRTATYARAWLDYATAEDLPTDKARQLCQSASGVPCD